MMDYNPKIHYIPARPKPIKRVGIYCRVSSSKDEQLKSLSNQISGLTRRVDNIPSWRIMDMYVEIRSAKGETNRSELNRLIVDCKNDKLDIVVLREVSRLGRDTVETLESYRAVRNSGVCVIFDENVFPFSNLHLKSKALLSSVLLPPSLKARPKKLKYALRSSLIR